MSEQPPGSTPIQLLSARRLGYWLYFLGVYSLYFPINHFTQSRDYSTPMVGLDEAIEFLPSALYPYALMVPLVLLPFVAIRDAALLKRQVHAFVAAMVISYLCFLVFPVRMTLRPEIPEPVGFTQWAVALCFSLDPPNNCCPSLHVSLSFVGAMGAWVLDRTTGLVALLGALAVSVSTLFLRQHFLVDIVLAMMLCGWIYWLLFRPLALPELPPEDKSRVRRAGLGLLGLYGGGVLLFWLLYLLDTPIAG